MRYQEGLNRRSSNFNVALALIFLCFTTFAESHESGNQLPSRLVIIDSSIEDSRTLTNGVKSGYRIEYLNSQQDGVTQLGQILEKYKNIEQLHLISHGEPGALLLGKNRLDSSTLENRRTEILQWSNAFSPDAVIALYGCEVAAGTHTDFVETFGDIIGASIFASTDVTTGNEAKGNWELEFASGSGVLTDILDSEVKSQYLATLAIPAGFSDQIVLDNLVQPVDVVVLPSGEMLLLLRGGEVLLVNPFTSPATQSVYLDLPNVDSDGEKGLLSIAIDPDFSTNGYLYLYYHNEITDKARVSRFIHNVDHALSSQEFIIWEDNLVTSGQLISDHWGGSFGFGPDDNLYLAIGDKKDNPNDAQDLNLTAGKILRFNTSGADSGGGPWVDGAANAHLIPVDNPYIDGAGGIPDEIWALGIRNPFRGKWDLPTGRFFIGEVGGNVQSGNDRSHEDIHVVTVADAQANFGWPSCEGPDCVGAPPANYSAPWYSLLHADSRAIIVGPIYRGTLFPPQYQNAMFIADFGEGWLRYLTLDAAGNVAANVPAGGFQFSADDDLGKPVSLTIGVDEALYYVDIAGRNATGGGQLRRITYDNGNAPPVILSATSDASGPLGPPAMVTFTGSAIDPEGQPLSYSWNLDDGTTLDGSVVNHTYTTNGSFSVTLTVSDGVRSTTSTPIEILVGAPPVPSISSPLEGSSFVGGETVLLKGSATDSDGTITHDDLKWTVQFLHDDHQHPRFLSVAGYSCSPAGSSCFDLVMPDSGHDFSGNTGYEITLEVTDSDGIFATQMVTIDPDKVDLSVSTNVPGSPSIFVDQIPRTTPFVLDSLIGFQHTLLAQQTLVSSGFVYEFQNWSGGSSSLSLDITIPSSPVTYVAQYVNVGTVERVTNGLLALYPFDEGSGVVVHDVSSAGSPDLTIANGSAVSWTDRSLNVNSPTVIASAGTAASISNAISAANALTVEAWLTPDNTSQDGPARVVSISANSTNRNFTLGQGESSTSGGTNFDFRLRTSQTGNNGNNPSLPSAPGSATTALTHVVYTRNSSGAATIYVNGVNSGSETIGGNLSNWNSTYGLLMANEAGGGRPWLGTLELVAVYDRALTESEVLQNFDAGPDLPNEGTVLVNAQDDVFSVDADQTLSGENVLSNNGNGADIGTGLQVTAIEGLAANVGNQTALSLGGLVTVAANGDMSYDPNGVIFGTESFSYTINDGNSGTDTATVMIQVNMASGPTAVNDTATVAARGFSRIQVLANDIGTIDPTTLTLLSQPSHGRALVNADGTITYLHNGTGSSDSIMYTVDSDTGVTSNTATLSITFIQPGNRPPVAADDSADTTNNNPVIIAVLDNDIDLDGNIIPDSVFITNGPANGMATANANGTITYTHDGSMTTTDSFQYVVDDDDNATSNPGTVQILVIDPASSPPGEFNSPPIAIADTIAINPAQTVTINLTDNDTDASGGIDAETVSITTLPAIGTVTNRNDGTVSYTHVGPGSTDQFEYTVEDNLGALSNAAPVTISVSPADNQRISNGIEALYTFSAGSGVTVFDRSGLEPAIDLTIQNANAVSWLPGSLSVENNTSIESSDTITRLATAISSTNEITVEVWINSDNLTQNGPARIVSYSTDAYGRNFTLGQAGDQIQMRLRTTLTDANGVRRSLLSPPGLLHTAQTHVVYTRTENGTARLYLNGAQVSSRQTPGDLSGWDMTSRLNLANEFVNERPWLGELDLVAIYSRALNAPEVNQNYSAGP